MTYKRKKYHYGDTHLRKKWRTKRRKKDLDEVSLVVVQPAQISEFEVHVYDFCNKVCVGQRN
jgi:hypothetical protein